MGIGKTIFLEGPGMPMFCANRLANSNLIVIAAVISVFAVVPRGSAQDEKDPHRSACTSAYCKKVKSFLKEHYRGESPGNGPDDGCDLRDQRSREQASVSRSNRNANGVQATARPNVYSA
jgi:hypothetical protein